MLPPLDTARSGLGRAQGRRLRSAPQTRARSAPRVDQDPLEGDIATVDRQSVGLTPDALGITLRAAFERELGITFESSVPEPEERVQARLLGARYLDPAFTRRR